MRSRLPFHIIRDDQDKNDFANRMNLMFPDAEKKCISNSFRRMENIMNHNKDFAEWHKDTDPDYKIAREFYDKLKKMTEYKRTFYFA